MDLDNAAHESSEQPWYAGGLRFLCTSCGKCCTGASGSVFLSAADLERLAGFLKLPPGRFARRYTRLIKGRRVLLDQAGSHDCVFLDGKTCSVYEARPTQCRTYPWWLTNVADRQSWDEAAALCEGIDHPDAPLIPAAAILEQAEADLQNEADLRRGGSRQKAGRRPAPGM